MLHAIHTTADFEMEDILYTDPDAVENLFHKFQNGEIKTIVTDVTMAASGIRKGALHRLGVDVRCYLGDERTVQLAKEKVLHVHKPEYVWLQKNVLAHCSFW